MNDDFDIILVRHGETEVNRRGAFQGSIDAPLGPAGFAQATELRSALQVDPDTDYVVASTQRRARQTAGRLLGADDAPEDGTLPAGLRAVDAALREVDFGPWEDRTNEEIVALDPVGFAAYHANDLFRFPGGERTDEAASRALEAISEHATAARVAGAERAILVTHGTLIRLAATALLGLPSHRYRALFRRPDHCSWARFTTDGQSWRLDTYNRTAA
jgi:broad specificity phosphatase PhoE